MDHEAIQQYYEQVYTNKTTSAFAFDKKRYLAWLNELPQITQTPKRSLDIGCGAGFICALLQEQGYAVHGNDISQKAIELAKSKIPQGQFHLSQPDGQLKYPDEHFDLITCLGVLEHIPQPEPVLKECLRVLKKDGYVLFIVPNSRNPYFWFGGTEQIEEHPRSLKQWSELFTNHGFSIINVTKDPGPTYHRQHSFLKKIKIRIH
ncbi:MAG: class I SAM-dependent methyltransferase, partial [Candidatus Omnitrophica bacterium]|nr:class I SAM-dependent methyltransferase [Candidatus Omnitrophota bacterium]